MIKQFYSSMVLAESVGNNCQTLSLYRLHLKAFLKWLKCVAVLKFFKLSLLQTTKKIIQKEHEKSKWNEVRKIILNNLILSDFSNNKFVS